MGDHSEPVPPGVPALRRPSPARAILSYAGLAAAVRAHPPRLGPVRLVSVDGRSGAGKTTTARHLSAALADCPVIHMDDLYEGWHGLESAWPRLEEWVLAPLRAGRPGAYRRYDWERGWYAEWHWVGVPATLIVEGVGAADRRADGEAVLRLWIHARRAIRRERGLTRDGAAFEPYWDTWAAQEDHHFAANATERRADLMVIGDSALDHEPAAELVVRA